MDGPKEPLHLWYSAKMSSDECVRSLKKPPIFYWLHRTFVSKNVSGPSHNLFLLLHICMDMRFLMIIYFGDGI